MGFKSLIAKQVQNAFKILGTDEDGLAPVQTYVSVNQGAEAYDPVTRKVTKEKLAYAGIPMTLVRFSIEDMNADVKPKTDRKALIPALDLPCIPNEQDLVLLSTGETYTVHKVMSDPTASLHILQVRRTS